MSVTPAVFRKIMKELNELRSNPPEGIRVVCAEENMLDVTGIIQGPEGTPYAGGYFKVKFVFGNEFPAAPPKCWFATKIFHPNVSGAGEICVNTLKKDWKSSYGIGHILVTVKCLLIYPNPESALDEEAGKLLLENYDLYCKRAKLMTGVHATPKVKPVEFETPSVSESSPTTSSTTNKPPSTAPTTTSNSENITVLAIPPTAANVAATPVKASTGPTKSKSSPSNISPLGTAGANIGAGIASKTASGDSDPTAGEKAKAVKRAAAGTGIAGAEKRKKALKRL